MSDEKLLSKHKMLEQLETITDIVRREEAYLKDILIGNEIWSENKCASINLCSLSRELIMNQREELESIRLMVIKLINRSYK